MALELNVIYFTFGKCESVQTVHFSQSFKNWFNSSFASWFKMVIEAFSLINILVICGKIIIIYHFNYNFLIHQYNKKQQYFFF